MPRSIIMTAPPQCFGVVLIARSAVWGAGQGYVSLAGRQNRSEERVEPINGVVVTLQGMLLGIQRHERVPYLPFDCIRFIARSSTDLDNEP
jgi:hypothetical protein